MAQAARNLEVYSPIPYKPAVAGRETTSKGFNFANFLAIILFLFALMFVYVYQQTLVAQESMNISKLRTEIRQRETANQKMKIEAEILRSPARIELLAGELGMVKDELVDYLVIDQDKDKAVSERDTKKGLIASMLSSLQK